MHTILHLVHSMLLSVAAIYFFILIIRTIALLRLRKFFGNYAHITPANEKPDDVTFSVTFDLINFFSPIPRIVIKIRRSSAKDSLHNDWNGWFVSNIIFLYYFKGRYELENPGPDEYYGWHHLYLFDKPTPRIIMNLQYVKDNKNIVSDEAYYIVKK
ncbi:MAG: hypothetical protein QM802_16980 [Agriterribacter sp.]